MMKNLTEYLAELLDESLEIVTINTESGMATDSAVMVLTSEGQASAMLAEVAEGEYGVL